MRSKWLDWTPEVGSVGFEGFRDAVFPITQSPEGNGTPILSFSTNAIIGKVAAGGPTKPTELTSVEHDAHSVDKQSYFWSKYGDAYGWRAHTALDAICEIPAPEGLMVWLGEHAPFLYRRLTRDLPNEISRAWDARVPYEDFDALCLELVHTYRRGTALYLG